MLNFKLHATITFTFDGPYSTTTWIYSYQKLEPFSTLMKLKTMGVAVATIKYFKP